MPLQFRRIGWMPAACQPMLPWRSTHTMFSDGMLLNAHAALNSSHVVAWFMRRLARYGAPPGSIHAGAKRIGLAVRAILEEHRTVPRVLQLDGFGLVALHGNRVGDDAHRFPVAAVAIFVGVGGIGFVDVEIFRSPAEDGQAPRTVFVVADRYARQHRLAAADHVPAGRDEMHPIAERWRGDRRDADRSRESAACSAFVPRRSPSCSNRCRADRRRDPPVPPDRAPVLSERGA